LRTPNEDLSEGAASETSSVHGTDDGKSTNGERFTRGRLRSLSVSSQVSRSSRVSKASNKSRKSTAGSDGGGVEMGKVKPKAKDEDSSDEDSEEEFNAGPADKVEDQRVWVRSLLWS